MQSRELCGNIWNKNENRKLLWIWTCRKYFFFFFVCGRGDGGKNNFLAVNRNNRQSFWFIVFLCGGLEFDVNRKLVLKAIFWVNVLFM